MLWLIDEGDEYHQMVAFVVKGDKHPKDVIAKYRKKMAAHIKEYTQLESKARKAVGQEPKLSRSCVSQKAAGKWREESRKWRIRQQVWINKQIQNPAPSINDELKTAGYEILKFQIVSLER